ncbi:Sec1-like protein [Fimicolochytrium jonesii]|uniref:Sec1-like protein n=1 Tax=Fimicolochytrium jonesii TaxID=1396493 RepID=UPI0022FEFBB3|nr:Sec1-like protein [Fimicolochytrium jonesii]KAI8820209.1 Sec1-like protein [Fimicolochytrium jonesii]
MAIKDLLRRKILDDMIKAVNPPGKWKVLVVDEEALRILNTAVKQSDLTDGNVMAVEGLAKRRQPFPDRDVIYFIAPDPASVQRIVDDFATQKPPYARVHIYSTAPLPDPLFDKIKRSPVSPFISAFKELNVDFSAHETHVFTVDVPNALKTAFNPQSPSLQNYELDRTAKRLASVLASLGDYPYIRYYDPTPGATESPAGKFANLVQADLDNLARRDRNFPPPSNYARTILLIVDRAADLVSPLLHQFTYQSMVMDLLNIEGNKFQPPDGDEVKLDENDLVWSQARHWHIAEVMEFLAESVNKFTSENKAAAFALDQGNASSGSLGAIEKLKETMAHLPQYQEMKAKYSGHTSMCHQAMQVYNKNRLERVAEIEQDLAVGETSGGKSARLVLRDILMILDDPAVRHEDKIRLVMLYVVIQNGLSESDRQKLLESARLSVEEAQAVHNLSMLGVKLSTSLMGRKADNRGQYAYGLRDRGKEHKFDNTRYTPVLRYIVEDIIKNLADGNVFPWVREPPPTENSGRPATWATSGPSSGTASPAPMRAKASWATRRAVVSANVGSGSAGAGSGTTGFQPLATEVLRANGPRMIVFVLGGVTPGEMKVCYDLIKTHHREIIIGSTHLITPKDFLEDLKDLHRHGPTQRPRRTSAGNQPTGPRPAPAPLNRSAPGSPSQVRPSRHAQDEPPSRYGHAQSTSRYREEQQPLRYNEDQPPRRGPPPDVYHRVDPPARYTPPEAEQHRRPSAGAVSNRVGSIEARLAAVTMSDRPRSGESGVGHAPIGRDSGRGGGRGYDDTNGRDYNGGRRYSDGRSAGNSSSESLEKMEKEKEKEKKKGWFSRK